MFRLQRNNHQAKVEHTLGIYCALYGISYRIQ